MVSFLLYWYCLVFFIKAECHMEELAILLCLNV